MNITNEYPVIVYKKEIQGNIFYSVGLLKKNADGSYKRGYIPCKFQRNINIDVDKKIYIREAWLSFYLKDKKTIPYIFINKFDYVEDVIKSTKKEIDPFNEFDFEIEIDEDNLPF